MSRYVHIPAAQRLTLDQLEQSLVKLGLAPQRLRHPVMLEGSLECPGEPIDLRLPAGTLDTVEDFGFVRDGSGVRLVCGELDRDTLEAQLLPAVRQAATEIHVRAAADQAGLEVEPQTTVAGERRLVIRRR